MSKRLNHRKIERAMDDIRSGKVKPVQMSPRILLEMLDKCEPGAKDSQATTLRERVKFLDALTADELLSVLEVAWQEGAAFYSENGSGISIISASLNGTDYAGTSFRELAEAIVSGPTQFEKVKTLPRTNSGNAASPPPSEQTPP